MSHQYFYEDLVYTLTPENNSKKDKVKFGLVLESFELTDDPDEDSIKAGELRVAWYPLGRDEIVKENNVGLADRTLMPGDVVRRIVSGSDKQRGYCREIHVKADVKIIGSKFIIKDVSSERLLPLVQMPRDNAVCLDSWVGSTKNIDEKLTLKSSCGSILELRPDIEYCPLKDKNMKTRCGFFAGTLFYVGQTLVGPVSELDNAKWLNTSPEMRTSRKHKTVDRKFVVQAVEIEGVWVAWQCKASCEEANDSKDTTIPKSYVTGEDLKRMKRLNLFESCMLQINDKNYLKINENDVIVKKSQWQKEQSNKYKIISNKQTKKKSLTSKEEHLICDKVKLTTTDCDPNSADDKAIECCDKSKLCVHKDPKKSQSHRDSDDWLTEEDNDSMSDSGSGTTVSSCSSNATPKGSPKKSPLLANKIRKLKKKSPRLDSIDRLPPQLNEDYVTEALVVYSIATVVWQDGTIETDIPSVDLSPIHHLDDHEFFPADFVLSAADDHFNPSFRDYGVIQKVDHHGRTALVKWFSTYTNMDIPQPLYKGESEVSVYDLKDHPDFQYRPGTIVIRVANFVGDDENVTAGQVVDNFPEGRVKVWWVNGNTSMCWPQDLFEVGQYDSENNFWGNAESDNDSWETEDETSEPGGISQPQHLTANLERARVAMARLEEMFIINPTLQSQEVMKKLLLVYKKCRYLDRLMNTQFFHESNFMGLVEKVRKSGNQTTAERVQDQKNRLFTQGAAKVEKIAKQDSFEIRNSTKKVNLLEIKKTASSSNSHEDNSYGSFESTKSLTNPSLSVSPTSSNNLITSSPIKSLPASSCLSKQQKNNLSTCSDISSIPDDHPDLHKLSCISLSPINKNRQSTAKVDNRSDSGILITLNSEGAASSSSQDPDDSHSSYLIVNSDLPSQCVCTKLCSLIKLQLVKALQEINNRYGPNDTFKEIVEPEEEIVEEEQEIEKETVPESTEKPLKEMKIDPDVSMEEISQAGIEDEAVCKDFFQVMDVAPSQHKYHLTVFHPTNAQKFFKAVQKEHKLLRSSLPPGVIVRTFEDRLDLLSIMIEGPKNTPYEDGVFLFDIQLGHDYPRTPPLCHYISYCSDRLNPNLYEDGKVCVSLLGTWSGRGTEIWCSTSTLLQVIVSIQGLILVDQPYFNEAGYEKQRGTQQGKENSRMYNEMVILKLVQSMTKLMSSPPDLFHAEILGHFKSRGGLFHKRIQRWMTMSNEYNASHHNQDLVGEETPEAASLQPSVSLETLRLESPDFPLIPASRGFCLTLAGLLENFFTKLEKLQSLVDSSAD